MSIEGVYPTTNPITRSSSSHSAHTSQGIYRSMLDGSLLDACVRGNGTLFIFWRPWSCPITFIWRPCRTRSPTERCPSRKSCRSSKERRHIESIANLDVMDLSGSRSLSIERFAGKRISITRSITCWRIRCEPGWWGIRWIIRAVWRKVDGMETISFAAKVG